MTSLSVADNLEKWNPRQLRYVRYFRFQLSHIVRPCFKSLVAENQDNESRSNHLSPLSTLYRVWRLAVPAKNAGGGFRGRHLQQDGEV